LVSLNLDIFKHFIQTQKARASIDFLNKWKILSNMKGSKETTL
jgi:hypothetical protein